MASRRMKWRESLNDPILASRPDWERVLWDALIVLADDEGRGCADPAYLRHAVWGYHPKRNERWVDETLRNLACHMHNLVLYKVGGRLYYCLAKWKTYQKIRKDVFRKSEIPPPPARSRNSTASASLRTRNEADPQGSSGQVSGGKCKDPIKGGERERRVTKNTPAGSTSASSGAEASPARKRLIPSLANQTLMKLYLKHKYKGMLNELQRLGIPQEHLQALTEAMVQSLVIEERSP